MSGRIPLVSAEQMREVDRIAVEVLHLELIQMMENAGRNLAELAIRRYHPHTCTILAGPGGNGGGGLVAARHLLNRGVDVRVVLDRDADALAATPRHQLDILERLSVAVQTRPPSSDLIVDALVGYSLRGDPQGRTAELTRWANSEGCSILALDTPSGLDVTNGEPADPCIVATATMTLALPKRGLLLAGDLVGELWLADISIPRSAYTRIGVEVPPLFDADTVVPVRPEEAGDV